MSNFEMLCSLATNLGQKIVEIYNSIDIWPKHEGIPLELSIQINEKNRLDMALDSIRSCVEYSNLLEAFKKSSLIKNTQHPIQEVLSEFILETIGVVARGRVWDAKWMEKELSLIIKALLQGLIEPTPDRGILLPLLNLKLDTYSIDLGEFGTIRRSTFNERISFTIYYPDGTRVHHHPSFKYVLDVGTPDSESLYPVPDKYLKILESVIMAIRLVFGDGVGAEHIYWWQKVDDVMMSSIPISKYLAPRNEPTTVYSNESNQLLPILRPIKELDEESCYRLALRRYGTALYTLDFRFGDAVVHSIIGLESIFGYPKDKAIPRILELTRNRYQQITRLFQTGRFGEVCDLEFSSLLENCWKARNKIAHGDPSDVAVKKAGMHLYWVSRISLLFLRFSLLNVAILGFPEQKELVKELDSKIIFPQKGLAERLMSFFCRKFGCYQS